MATSIIDAMRLKWLFCPRQQEDAGTRTHDARAVANYLLRVNSDGKCDNPLTPLQVIKLVYICQGWMLGLYRQALITQAVEAWQYGPIINDLHQAIKGYRSNPITERIDARQDPEFTDIEKDLMGQAIDKYGHLSGVALSTLTHQPWSPWYLVWHDKGCAAIPNKMIEEHFSWVASQTS